MTGQRQRSYLRQAGLRATVTASLFALCLESLAGCAPGAAGQGQSGPAGRRVLEHFLGAVSADGRFMSYTDWSTGDLALRDLESGATRHLTKKGTWEVPEFAQAVQAISPDGKYAAYGWQGPSTCDLRIVELAGSEPRILHRDDEIAHVLPKSWSPDGEQILAVLARKDGRQQIVTVPVGEGSVRVLKTFAGGAGSRAGSMMAFSPDGRFVVFDVQSAPGRSARDIHLLTVAARGETPLVESTADDYVLGWPAESESLFFASNRSGSWDIWALEVIDGEPRGLPRRVRADVPPTEWAMFSRDGAYFYARVVWQNDVYLTALDPETGLASELKRVIDHVGFNTSAAWSPDGRFLAYALGRGRHPDPFVLGIRSLETGEDRRFELAMERLGGHAFDPHWSPDGRTLLGSGRQGAYRIDPQTGTVSVIVGSPGGCPGSGECIEWPVWASSERIVFARFDDRLAPRQIVVRDLETGAEEELYRVTAPAVLSQFAGSPDGRLLAFVQTEPATGVSSLNVVSTTPGGPVRELATQPGPRRKTEGFDQREGSILRPAWGPDGRTLFFASLEAGDRDGEFELWKISADGGDRESLGLAVKGLRLYGLRVHPDGRRIAVTAGEPRRQETWVIDSLAREPSVPAASASTPLPWPGCRQRLSMRSPIRRSARRSYSVDARKLRASSRASPRVPAAAAARSFLYQSAASDNWSMARAARAAPSRLLKRCG